MRRDTTEVYTQDRLSARRRLLGLAVVFGLLLAACSSQAEGTTTTTVDTPTTTIDSPTTTPPPTTNPSTPPTTGDPDKDTNDLASGSGCKPGSETSLPDGEWYGYIVDLDATQIEFDLACWFTGDAAIAAADEDGAESPPPNDYYIRNDSDTVRSLAVEGSAEVEYLMSSGDPNTVTTGTYEEWSAEWEIDGFSPGYWVTIEDGKVVSIVQQYVP